VTALGDEVNEAARIEACASGGRMLASKNLIERLDPNVATALAINLDRLTYTRLAELSTATEKARNDAPAIAVCEVWELAGGASPLPLSKPACWHRLPLSAEAVA
jgi:hypothetical protein